MVALVKRIEAKSTDQLLSFLYENSPSHGMINLKPVGKLCDNFLSLLQIFERLKIVVQRHFGIREQLENPFGIGWKNCPKLKSVGFESWDRIQVFC